MSKHNKIQLALNNLLSLIQKDLTGVIVNGDLDNRLAG